MNCWAKAWKQGVLLLKDDEAWTWVLTIVWKKTDKADDTKWLVFGVDLVSWCFRELPC